MIFHKIFKKNPGFTMIEIMLAMGIVSIIALITFGSFSSMIKAQSLDKNANALLSLIQSARSETLSSLYQSQYGVHFEEDRAILFKGDSYIENSSDNQILPFTSSVILSSVSLAGGGSDLIFERITGSTAQYGQITMISPSFEGEKIIKILSSGISELQ